MSRLTSPAKIFCCVILNMAHLTLGPILCKIFAAIRYILRARFAWRTMRRDQPSKGDPEKEIPLIAWSDMKLEVSSHSGLMATHGDAGHTRHIRGRSHVTNTCG